MPEKSTTVTVAVPRPFRFRLMVLSHGWSDLPPFRWDEEAGALDAAWVEGGRAVAVRVTSERDRTEGQRLRARVVGGPPMDIDGKKALRARLRWIFRLDKGFGPYAANSLLLGFGRYDRLVLDSWIRKTVASVHFRSPKVADRSIERHYARFGEWKALACWFDCAWASWMKDAIAGPSDRFGGTVS